jgi:DHA1 family multidrug resistance protein B-like MFS transporter
MWLKDQSSYNNAPRSEHFGVPNETWVIFAIRTINSFGFSATLPFLGVYLLRIRHVPLGNIGVIYLATGIVGIASQVLSGRLTDSIGPKKVMLLGYASSLISSLILGFLVSINAVVLGFFTLYPLFSLFRGISQPATASIIAKQRPSQIRTGFSFLTIGGNLGFAIGPALSGFIIDAAGYSTAFVLSATAAGIAFIIASALIKGGRSSTILRTENKTMRWLTWKQDSNIILFLILIFSMFLCIGYEITPVSLYVASVFRFSNTLIGYLFATNGILIVIFQLPITRLIEKSRTLLLPLVFSAALAITSFMIGGYSRSFLDWEIFMTVITLAEITLTVPSQSIIALFSTEGNRGTYQGFYSAFSNAGRSVASFIGPLSFVIFGSDTSLSWFAIGAFALATGIGLAILSPKIQKDYEARTLSSDQ